MGRVVRLEEWLRARTPGEERLEDAVTRLDDAVRERYRDRAPSWLATEVLAVQGCISLGLLEDAAARTERLLARLAHPSTRARTAGR